LNAVHPEDTFQVLARLLVAKCDLFANFPALAAAPYCLKSSVSLVEFRQFLSTLEGRSVKVTIDNFTGLSQLSEEFQFREMATLLSQFRECGELTKAAATLSKLEERVQQRDQEIAEFQAELSRQSQAQEKAVTALIRRLALMENEMSARRSEAETDTGPIGTQFKTEPEARTRILAQEEQMQHFKRDTALLRCALSRESRLQELAEKRI
jgi:hypothetical protein